MGSIVKAIKEAAQATDESRHSHFWRKTQMKTLQARQVDLA